MKTCHQVNRALDAGDRLPLPLAGERLSGLSSCKGILFSRFACLGVEADEELSGEGDAGDHLWLSGVDELLMEVVEAFVEPGGDVCDEKEDRADIGSLRAQSSRCMMMMMMMMTRRRRRRGRMLNNHVDNRIDAG